MAEVMSDVLGRSIRYDCPREDAYLKMLADEGAPQDYIAVQKMIHRVVRLNISAFTNHSVRKLTGKPATTVRQFVEDYRDSW